MVTRVVAIDNIPFKEEGYLQQCCQIFFNIQSSQQVIQIFLYQKIQAQFLSKM